MRYKIQLCDIYGVDSLMKSWINKGVYHLSVIIFNITNDGYKCVFWALSDN